MSTSILLYGRSGVGKSTQIGKLAEEEYIKTGKITRVYSGDFGGSDVNAPYIDLGIIETVEIGSTDPWIFLANAVRGKVRDDNGKWKLDKERNHKVGIYAYESAHGIAKLLQLNMNEKAGTGSSIGGDTNASFEVAGDGEKFKIGSVKGYQQYAIPQQQILVGMYESFKLPADYVIWSAGVDSGNDELGSSKVVGPLVIGSALTAVLPKDFNYSFHLDAINKNGKLNYILYLGLHQDPNAGNATALGNARRPVDAPEITNQVIEPADLVRALKLVREEAKVKAIQKIQARIEAAKKASVTA